MGQALFSGFNTTPGVNQIATFTISVASGATGGTYQLRSFDYSGFGWSSESQFDQNFDNQAAINVVVAPVPEPGTLSLVILGGLGAVGMIGLRRRRA